MSIARTGWRQVRRGREAVAAVRTCGERHVLARRGTPTPITSRILCYHSTGTPRWGVNDVTPRQFGRQVETLLESGFRIVAASELTEAGTAEDGPDKRIALTFDDGVSSLLTGAAPILADLGVPWTVFVVTDWAEGRHGMGDLLLTWEQTAQLADAGATIASHSATHPDFATLGPAETLDELGRSRAALRDRLGIDTVEFAIPFGQSGNWPEHARTAARAVGYRTVYAQSMDRRPAGTVPRTFITRFDNDRLFRAALGGSFDRWEEWM